MTVAPSWRASRDGFPTRQTEAKADGQAGLLVPKHLDADLPMSGQVGGGSGHIVVIGLKEDHLAFVADLVWTSFRGRAARLTVERRSADKTRKTRPTKTGVAADRLWTCQILSGDALMFDW